MILLISNLLNEIEVYIATKYYKSNVKLLKELKKIRTAKRTRNKRNIK